MIPINIQEQLLQDALGAASLSRVTVSQKMLGGFGISVKGTQFALLLPQGTALKLPPPEQEHLLKIPGAARYEIPGDPARSNTWVILPQALLDQTPHYASWVRKAFQFNERQVPQGRRLPPKPGRKVSHGRSSR